MASNPDLNEALTSASSLETAITLAKDAGYNVSTSELLSYIEAQDIELSMDDLAAVAGGGNAMPNFFRMLGNIARANFLTSGRQQSSASGWQNPKL